MNGTEIQKDIHIQEKYMLDSTERCHDFRPPAYDDQLRFKGDR